MITLIDKLNSRIKNDDYFLDENKEIIKEKLKTSSLNLDEHLISILLSDEELKSAFFIEKNGVLIFDKVKFSWIISNSNFLPDSYTSYKNKIGLIDSNGDFLKSKDDVMLSFPYKDCILEFDSTNENEDRDEVFLNETLAKDYIDTLISPKVLEKAVLHDKEGTKIVDKYNGENLIIKGNNLISLYSLLPRFEGKIKFIYWDILYNTDNDKVPYNDKFKHSSWLTMMKNRLTVASRLLRKDNGVISIQCDDNEQAYLKVLCDEVFGRENFVNCIAVKMSEATGVKMAHASKRFPKLKEYILVYKKGEIKINTDDILVPVGELGVNYKSVVTGLTKEEISRVRDFLHKDSVTENDVQVFDELVKGMTLKTIPEVEPNWKTFTDEQKAKWKVDNAWRIVREVSSASAKKIADVKRTKTTAAYFGIRTARGILYLIKGNYSIETPNPNIKLIFGADFLYVNPCDFWEDIKTTRVDNEGGVELLNGKKPETILKRLISAFTQPNDIVLDAYFGTGTTGAVAMKMNRKFIGLEQLNNHYEKSINRLENVVNGDKTGISEEVGWNGGSSFISCELSKFNEKIISQIIDSPNETIMDLYDEIINSPFLLNYKVNLESMKDFKNKEEFVNMSLIEKQKLLVEVLDKNILYVNLSEIDDESKEILKVDKRFTRSFYGD